MTDQNWAEKCTDNGSDGHAAIKQADGGAAWQIDGVDLFDQLKI